MTVTTLPLFLAVFFDHVLVSQHLVGHLGHGVKAHVDFSLAAGGDFVVMDFDLDSAFL